MTIKTFFQIIVQNENKISHNLIR